MAINLLRYISSLKGSHRKVRKRSRPTLAMSSTLRNLLFMKYPLLQHAISRSMIYAGKSCPTINSLIQIVDDFKETLLFADTELVVHRNTK